MTIPAFEDFFEQQHVRLARALYALTGSAAEVEELAQDAWFGCTSGGIV